MRKNYFYMLAVFSIVFLFGVLPARAYETYETYETIGDEMLTIQGTVNDDTLVVLQRIYDAPPYRIFNLAVSVFTIESEQVPFARERIAKITCGDIEGEPRVLFFSRDPGFWNIELPETSCVDIKIETSDHFQASVFMHYSFNGSWYPAVTGEFSYKGFSFADIVISVFLLIITIVTSYSFLFFWVRGIKIKV